MVLISPEDVTINGIKLSQQFDRGNGYFIVNSVSGRDIAPRTLNLVSANGQDGAYFLGSTLEVRPMDIEFTLKGDSFADLRSRLEELNGILIKDELLEIRFADEPNRLYYGVVSGGQETLEKSAIHKGVIQIQRPDPYKYGNEILQDFVNGTTTVNNTGNYPTFPKFTFTALADITNVDVFYDEAYMRIGKPSDVGTTPIARNERVLWDDASTLSGWTTSTTMESGTVLGTMGTNGFSFHPATFGTDAGWHGPARQKSIPQALLTDFQVDVQLQMLNENSKQLGRVVIELLDDAGAVMARMNMNKRSIGSHGNEGVIRMGNVTGQELIETMGSNNTAYKNFRGIMRIARIGDTWTAYIAQINPTTKKHHSRSYKTFRDVLGKYNKPLAQIRIHFGGYSTAIAPPMVIEDIKVFKINAVQPTSNEIIANSGDVIEIDHAANLITINGEERIDLKDFGGTFFPLESGLTPLLIEPSDKLQASIAFRERYL